MRVIILGYGVQGRKRKLIAGAACAAVVDPVHPEADYRDVADVPLTDYDAALVCTPDSPKFALLRYLLGHRKHVLVEKPLLTERPEELQTLIELAAQNDVCCYTAYNHRFEPHFVRMHELLQSGVLGKIYSVRLFYGNGTARLVRDSVWRDSGPGVLPDLGSHLLDTLLYWFGPPPGQFQVHQVQCFENQAPDYCVVGMPGTPAIQLEMTLLSWRNHFVADILAEKGSAHIESLCKWGPTTFTHRTRVLPSGRPDQTSETLVQADPTWALEWTHFQNCCRTASSNLANDLWIDRILRQLSAAVLGEPS